MTTEQEAFLVAFADQGIAEAKAEAERIADAEAARVLDEARAAKLTDLQAQAETLIKTGLADFDTNVAPTIVSPQVSPTPPTIVGLN